MNLSLGHFLALGGVLFALAPSCPAARIAAPPKHPDRAPALDQRRKTGRCQRSQDGHDGDDDHQLNGGEAALGKVAWRSQVEGHCRHGSILGGWWGGALVAVTSGTTMGTSGGF